MTQNPSDPLKLEPVGVSSDGRRRYYDEEAKQKLVEACLQPGVSLAGMALKAGVNANLLRRWVSKHQEKRDGTVAMDVIEGTPSAFVPVVEIGRTDAQSRRPDRNRNSCRRAANPCAARCAHRYRQG
jgi:transposase